VATVLRNVDPYFSAGFAEPIAAVARGISEWQVYAAGRAPQGGVAQNEWEDGKGAHVGRHERRDSTLERRRRRRGRRGRRSGGSRTGQSQRRGGQCTQSYGDYGEFLHGKPSIGRVGQGIARNPYTCYTPAICLPCIFCTSSIRFLDILGSTLRTSGEARYAPPLVTSRPRRWPHESQRAARGGVRLPARWSSPTLIARWP
jgi:hypothetical protein